MKKNSSIHDNLVAKSYLTPSDILERYFCKNQNKVKEQLNPRGADTNWFQDWSRDWGKDWGKDAWRRTIP